MTGMVMRGGFVVRDKLMINSISDRPSDMLHDAYRRALNPGRLQAGFAENDYVICVAK